MDLLASQLLHIARRRCLVRWPALDSRLDMRPKSIRAPSCKASLTTIATIPDCPKASCECAEMPKDLEIDYKTKLDGTVPPYAVHVVIRTSTSDWPSKIEDDERFPLVKCLKDVLGRKGKYHNTMLTYTSTPKPYRNILISTSSGNAAGSVDDRPISLFPSFRSLDYPLNTSSPSTKRRSSEQIAEDLISQHLFPQNLLETQPNALAQDTPGNNGNHDIKALTVLICGHGNRDVRCGVLGPILQKEFEKQLRRRRQKLPLEDTPGMDHSIELISHIGGHKFAGNVIMYFPKAGNGVWQNHPLAGTGIWLGRVRPEHVEGIVEETVLKGRVIKELFRGGIDAEGGTLTMQNMETVMPASAG